MIGYFLYPLYPAMYNFLPIAVISSILPPVLVVQFSVSRLFGRVITQISQILSRVLWPELLKKKTQEEFLSFSKKVIKSYSVVTVCILVVVFLGSYFIDGISYKGVVLSFNLIATLSVVAFFASFNDIILAILISQEKHFYPLVMRSFSFFCITMTMFYLNSITIYTISYLLLLFELIFFVVVLISVIKSNRIKKQNSHD